MEQGIFHFGLLFSFDRRSGNDHESAIFRKTVFYRHITFSDQAGCPVPNDAVSDFFARGNT